KPQGIDENMPLAALDLLAAVGPPFLAAQCGPNRLAVERGSTGRWRSPCLDPSQRAEDIEDLLPSPIHVPPLEVVVDGLPRGQMVGQCPPGTPFPGMVEQRVDNLAQIDFAGPTRPTAPLDARQQRLDQRPLLVRQVAGISFAFHAPFYANSQLWNRV